MMAFSKVPREIPEPYTQTPNAWYDMVMGEIDTLAELKVTEVIIRKTTGFHKDEDKISISQFMRITRLSRKSVIDGIERALKRGYVTRRAGKKYNGNEFYYKFEPPEIKPNLKAVPRNGKITRKDYEESLWN